jgi:hypothetical protein
LACPAPIVFASFRSDSAFAFSLLEGRAVAEVWSSSARIFASELGPQQLATTSKLLSLVTRSISFYCYISADFVEEKMKCYIQILGTDTGDSSPSILLFFDSHTLLLNAGEGIQRFFTEHKVRLRKVTHLMFTRLTEQTLGGLPGTSCLKLVHLFFPADIL